MKVTLLGTASCTPQQSRSSASILVEHDKIYLIDCGGETPRQILRAGYKLNDVDILVLTHMHGDHALGLPVLLQAMELMKRNKKLRVYCPPDAEAIVRITTEFSFPALWSHLPYEVAVEEIKGEEAALDGELRVAMAAHSVVSYSCRIGGMTYSSDTAPCERTIKLAKGSKVLIHEASVTSELEAIANKHGHSSARQAGIAAAKAGVEKLVLVHMEPMYEKAEHLLVKDARKEFGGEVIAGKDLMVMNL